LQFTVRNIVESNCHCSSTETSINPRSADLRAPDVAIYYAA
jgi:hypothetical protein